MAERALSAIPARLAMHVRGVSIAVEDMPDEETMDELDIESAWELTGVYRGTPLTQRSRQLTRPQTSRPEPGPMLLAWVHAS